MKVIYDATKQKTVTPAQTDLQRQEIEFKGFQHGSQNIIHRQTSAKPAAVNKLQKEKAGTD